VHMYATASNEVYSTSLIGVFDTRPDCPVVGDLSIRENRQSPALVNLRIVSGEGTISLGFGTAGTETIGAHRVIPSDQSDITTLISIFSRDAFRLPVAHPWDQGPVRGVADYQPSDSLARQTRLFERYLVTPQHFPVEIVVQYWELK